MRRITGYLVGTMDHWNDAKTAEEGDRVKHLRCEEASSSMEQL
ncbi:MAG: anaerobic ribonucleoside-triphosphate reductase [Anaerovoracaceae bacterium]